MAAIASSHQAIAAARESPINPPSSKLDQSSHIIARPANISPTTAGRASRKKMPTDTGDLSSSPMLLFGDMQKAAALGLRRDIRVRVDDSRYAEYDQIAMIATQRFDIVAHDVGDANTAGPLVALIGH